MSDKHEITQTENGPVRGGKKAALKNHCKRFWWLHLIIFLCISAAVICLVIFVGVKNIAQAKVNDADLTMQAVKIINPEPNKFTMQINCTITSDGTVKGDVDPFLGNLTLLDVPGARPFVQLNFPSTNSDKLQTVNISQEVQITDKDAFIQFNQAFYQNETLRVAVHGKTKIKPAGLSKKYDVDFYKVVTFKGLNKLNGTTIADMKIRIGTAEDGIPNFNATATFTNPSYYTIDMGNATFNNFADNQLLGNLTVQNLVLKPGKNVVPVSAILDQNIIVSAATKKPYCETGKINVELQATHVKQGATEIPWLVDSLGSANQTFVLSLADTFKAAGLGDFKATCSS